MPVLTAGNVNVATTTVWGAGDILLGGAGSDLIEGRGADDLIDGDRYLNVRLSVRTNADGTGPELGWASVDAAGQSAMTTKYLRDANGSSHRRRNHPAGGGLRRKRSTRARSSRSGRS